MRDDQNERMLLAGEVPNFTDVDPGLDMGKDTSLLNVNEYQKL